MTLTRLLRALPRAARLLPRALFFLCMCAGAAFAHPHSFVEADVTVLFDDEGLAGFREKWIIDEMTAFAILEENRENGDGRLDDKEIAAIKEVSMGSLKDYAFFTDVRIDEEPFKPKWFTDFHATLDNGKLIYEFLIPCHVKAAEIPKQVVMAVYDESFYTYIAYASEEGTGIDPTLDPLFANPSAEAKPGDFERFSEAVGLESSNADIRFEGPLEKFEIESEVRLAPEMAYFEDQIEPEAFSIIFRKK